VGTLLLLTLLSILEEGIGTEKKRLSEENIVYVGNRLSMSYVLAIAAQLNSVPTSLELVIP
jgi:hypothetical protein